MNKQLWDEFLSGKTVVNCRTENQAKKFMRICEGKGLKWGENIKATDDIRWKSYGEDACYSYNYYGDSYLGFSPKDFYTCEEKQVTTFKQLMKSDKPEQRQYKGWEIFKMIDEGKLKEGDIVIWHNGADSVQEKFHIGASGEFIFDKLDTDADSSYLNHKIAQSYFTLGEKKHYLTFDEARKTGKKFKYKDWADFNPLKNVLNMLACGYSGDTINQMLDERAWEVES